MMGVGLGINDLAVMQRKVWPIPVGPIVTAKGSAQGKAVGSLTIPNVTLTSGASLLVGIVFDATAANIDSVNWGAVPLSSITGGVVGVGAAGALAPFAAHAVAGGTADLVITWDAATTATAIAAEATGLTATPEDVMHNAQGSSTSPDSGATLSTAQASELLWGLVATNGPVEDAAGSWSNGFTAGQRQGTTGGIATSNFTISDGFLVVSSIGTYAAGKTGITSRAWGAAIVTLKAA